MVPIQQWLKRIRWDPEFGQGQFEIGYYDRVTREITRVAFDTMRFPAGDPFSFELIDAAGTTHRIPLHRIKTVYHNGAMIWQRAH